MSYTIKNEHSSAQLNPFLNSGLSNDEASRVRLLSHVHTDPEHRKQGYATKLLEDITKQADEAIITLITEPKAYDDSDFTDLKPFYEKHGFIEIQAEPLIMMRSPAELNLQPKKLAFALLDRFGRTLNS
jgi:GNAT superfamily N-acetyltransferase